jgi:hypothetical protein
LLRSIYMRSIFDARGRELPVMSAGWQAAIHFWELWPSLGGPVKLIGTLRVRNRQAGLSRQGEKAT